MKISYLVDRLAFVFASRLSHNTRAVIPACLYTTTYLGVQATGSEQKMLPTKNALSPRIIMFAASALVLAAAIQLATTWMQIRYSAQKPAECMCGNSDRTSHISSLPKFDFEKEYCKSASFADHGYQVH
jgi:hypothetical protein